MSFFIDSSFLPPLYEGKSIKEPDIDSVTAASVDQNTSQWCVVSKACPVSFCMFSEVVKRQLAKYGKLVTRVGSEKDGG